MSRRFVFSRPRGLAAALTAVSAMLALGGCQKKEEIGRITGQVTCDGAPVVNATVFFRDRGRGINIMSDVDANGSYQVFTAAGKGLPLGDYMVCVVPTDPTNAGTIEATRLAEKRTDVPKRYREIDTSDLKTTVGPGENVFNIEMKSKE